MTTIQTTHPFRCELQHGPCEVTLKTPLMHQDAMGDVFRVAVCQGGVPLDLTGMTVRGFLYFASTRQTMPLDGETDGHYASVTIPASGYAIPGHASLVIQLQQEEVRHTILKADFCIVRTASDAVVLPGDTLPTLFDLLDKIGTLATTHTLTWADIALYSAEQQAILLEAGKPALSEAVQAVFDGLNNSDATLSIEVRSTPSAALAR